MCERVGKIDCVSGGRVGDSIGQNAYSTDIKPMDTASESILALKPVSFRYKVHKDATLQFGLIAEQVAQVNPDLVVRDQNGEIYTVRYDAVNAMLLNEFLKEHSTVQELKKEIAALTATVREQSAKTQKVSAQLEASKFAAGRIRRGGPATQVVNNP